MAKFCYSLPAEVDGSVGTAFLPTRNAIALLLAISYLWRLLSFDAEQGGSLAARGVRIDGDVDLRPPRHSQQHDQLLRHFVARNQPRVERLQCQPQFRHERKIKI